MTCPYCDRGISLDNALIVALAEAGRQLTVNQLIEWGCKVYVELGARENRHAVQEMESGDLVIFTRPSDRNLP
jgi:hypothetical protein